MEEINEYVFNHDFGYGKDKENLNKLKLRNIKDLKDYITQIIEDMFFAKIDNLIVTFYEDNLKTEIFFEEIKN